MIRVGWQGEAGVREKKIAECVFAQFDLQKDLPPVEGKQCMCEVWGGGEGGLCSAQRLKRCLMKVNFEKLANLS